MIEKKVVVVIVEGPSDESAIGSILKEYFSSEEVQFAVTHGDITFDYKTTVDNVVTKICKLVDAVRVKYGYEWKHFIKIIHIADTDGAFTKGCVQKLEDKPEDGQEDKSKEEKIQYYKDHMETSNVEATEKRNEHKSEIMYKLYSTGKIHNIYYRFYFNSCNLEHVLYNELKDFSDEEKEELSDDFADKYEGKVQEFIDFISNPDVAVPGTYKETWKYIEKDKNSLQRHSNMHLIFE